MQDTVFVFFFRSTTIRIHIQPNTAVKYSVFGRILKTHIRYSPIEYTLYMYVKNCSSLWCLGLVVIRLKLVIVAGCHRNYNGKDFFGICEATSKELEH